MLVSQLNMNRTVSHAVAGRHSSVTAPRWVSVARARHARRQLVLAHSAVQSAAAAAESLAADAPSTSAPSSSQPTRSKAQQQQQRWQQGAPRQQSEQWTYKYQHFACSSPVDPRDTRCRQVEALFQNVLGYPRLPERIHMFVQRHQELGVEHITAVVEALDARFGKELVLYLLMREPHILRFHMEQMSNNVEAVRLLLDLKGCDMFMMLRKNPALLIMDPSVVRSRYDQLLRITPLSREDVKAMVRKMPLLLSRSSEVVAQMTERLRHLAYTRAMWQRDFEVITPSLLAFFYRDANDLLLRMEYLVLTGDSASWNLYKVFKPSNNLFQKKHRGYREWVIKRKARRQQQMQMRAQHMQMRGQALQAGPGPQQQAFDGSHL